MTAFTRQAHTQTWGTLIMEIRTVNHRYLDISVRLPEEFRALEMNLREQVQKRLSRGKVDLQLRFQAEQATSQDLQLNMDLVRQLTQASDQINRVLSEHRAVSPIEIMRWPGVLLSPEVDADEMKQAVLTLLDLSLQDLIASREREGEKLKAIIQKRCDGVLDIAEQVRKVIPEIKKAQRERLLERLVELKDDLDNNRVEQELVFLAQKMDVDEELDRLITHVNEVRRVLEQDKPVGRRLDFLMQELNREANTLGSKSIDAQTSTASVDLKVLIEQMREQIQNIE